MLDNQPARQNGLDKKLVAGIIPRIIARVVPRVIAPGSHFIYANFPRGRDPDFIYTEISVAEIPILSTQRDSLRRDPDFIYTKNSRATEMAFYLLKYTKIQKFSALRAPIC